MEITMENLRVAFPAPSGELLPAVRGVSLTLGREKLGIVGESGSGKSLTARSILRLLPRQAIVTADRLEYGASSLLGCSDAAMREIRGKKIGFIMQDPKFSLNPVMTIGAQIAESFRVHYSRSHKAAAETALESLAQVQIRDPNRVARLYPHEVSGGMGQRAMIAMMLAADPDVLIADEPTASLDVSVQSGILKLIDDLVTSRGMSLILISHDLPMVSRFCDRVIVMYAGRVVEELAAKDLMSAQHPYTRGLLHCLPSFARVTRRLPTITRDPSWLSQ
ncbi:ABC transporter ATP-binding protein [Mesorhizobium sp.]|uniref:ABC transporter ATP-binding protein n=1 Tax=Mesorhizobium sp. TaxID=1871066 RepID=UPI000FEA33AC|nr:ABC transporter ATP-binding protein [Mesorhizobium sp.]RWI87933.1 MAG: ABC transporter ATP-binding protein [Mesorhizobium sp.]